MTSAISWFEIPAADLNRAQKFYETILGIQMIPMEMEHFKMRMFPIDNPMEGTGGALIQITDKFFNNSASDGVLIYLNGNPDVQTVLDKIEKAGGKIVVPKTEISPEYGHMAVFVDSEGNRIGLHSVPPGK